jgi:radical SAM protein with 4Fe4S-binding SPASM domain
MFIERLGKVFRQSSHKETNENEPELKAIKYYQSYYHTHHKFPLFTQVLLETRTDCNRRCAFCPQAFQQRPFQEMPWEVFERIIHNVVELEFSGRLGFAMTNEPLLDSRLVEMVAYARKASPRFFLDVTTNGNPLTLELADALFAAGLDNLNINDYRSDRETERYKLSQNIEAVSQAYATNPKLEYNYRRTDEILSTRGGHVDKQTENRRLHAFCNYPFRKLAIAPSGDVVLCCMDYLYEVRFGNVTETSLEEIWHSQALNEYRVMLLNRKREGICAKCDEYQY